MDLENAAENAHSAVGGSKQKNPNIILPNKTIFLTYKFGIHSHVLSMLGLDFLFLHF